MAEQGWRWGKEEGTSDAVQHTCRTTVLGLSRFKCAANFDVIFFLSHCLKPLALFIIQALWSEQHGNNVSRRHTPSDGPLTAPRHPFLFYPPTSLSSLVLLFALSILTSSILLLILPLFLPFNCSPPFPSPHSFRFASSLFILYFGLAALMFLYLIDFPFSPHDWSLISNSIINWSLINGWLI